MSVKPLEVEIDGSQNQCLCFRPLPGRRIRGRMDLNRVAEPMAKLLTSQWPQPVPGQRIGIDAEGLGYVAEPLHDPEHATLREKIVKSGQRLAPPVETFEGIDQAGWLFWLRKAVEAGIARVVKGSFPDKLPGKPRMNFIMAEPKPSSDDRLVAAIERQNTLMAQLLERLGK